MSIAVAIFGLAFLVLIHEAGHFVVARLVGMNPRKFYVGFPPALVKHTRNGIEYGLGAIPLGGYVKIPGMHRPAGRDAEIWFGSATEQAPELFRPVQAVKTSLERGDYAAVQRELRELEVALADHELAPAAAKSARRGLEEIRDGSAPDAYWRSGTWKRLAVIFAGPAANIIAAAFLFAWFFAVQGGSSTTRIAGVSEKTPAAAAGFQEGDEIVAIGGSPIAADKIPDTINESKGKPLMVTLHKSDGSTVTIAVTPRLMEQRYRLGFSLERGGEAAPAALWHGVRATGIVTKEIGASLGRLVTGEGTGDVQGTVGIVQTSSTAVDQGLSDYMFVLALISLSLALFNLLPLLPLDGGHILFSLIEGIRRKPVPRDVYERVSAVGIALFLFVFMFTLTNDIGRL